MPTPKMIKCKHCGMMLRPGTVICSYCGKKTGAKKAGSGGSARSDSDAGFTIGDHFFPIPWVSLVILLLNIAAGVYMLIQGDRLVLNQYAMQQGSIEAGKWYRVFTSAFLHFTVPHFGTNMLSLVIYGFIFENKISRWKYALIYLLGIIGSGVMINFVGGNGLHAGASGALWGLMTGALIWRIRSNTNPLHAVYGIISSLYYTFENFNISWQGHIGGGIAGLLISLMLFRKAEKGYTN